MKPDYFITYHEDEEYAARWISGVLKEKGFSTLLESWYFLPGDSNEEKFKYALNACYSVMVLLSESFLQLGFTPETVRIVMIKNLESVSKRFIPVKVKTCNLTDSWSSIEVFDLVGVKEEEARKRLSYATDVRTRKEGESYPAKTVINYRDDILNKREQDYKELLSKILKRNYHMKINLEKEVEKEIEVKNERTDRYERRKMMVWEVIKLETVLSDRNDYILVNTSGMGKTTFLAYVAYTLLDRTKKYPFVPFLISCRDINKRDESIVHFLTGRLNSDYYNLETSVISGEWENLCLLMDALDQARDVDDILSSILPTSKYNHYKKAKIILSSRLNTASRVQEGFCKIRLQLPVNEEIKHYLGDENYMKLDTVIRSLRELIAVPVLLGMIKTIVERGHISSKLDNLVGLYTEFSRILIDHERRKPRLWENVSFTRHFIDFELEEALEKISFFSLANNEILEIDKEKLLKYCGSVEKKDALLNIGILLELFEDMEQKIVFRHQSFQAYFASRYIYYHRPDLFEILTEDIRYFFSDVWYEVIQFYVGLEKDSEKAEKEIESIFKKVGLLKKVIKKDNLEFALRLIFTFFLMFESRVSKEFILKVSLQLRDLLKRKKQYLNFILVNSNKFNKASKHYAISINTILEPLLLEDNYEIRCDVAKVLVKLGTPDHTPLLEPLLRDEKSVVRRAATIALGEIGSSGNAFQLEHLIIDKDSWVHSSVFEVLKKIGTSEHVTLIEPFLSSKNSKDRHAAFEVLGEIGTAINIPLLEPLLKCKDRIIRTDAAKALGKIVKKEDIPLLKRMLMDKSEYIRSASTAAFGNIGTNDHIPLLTPMLRDESKEVHSAATKSLGKILTKEDIHLLKPMFKDDNEYVRMAAIATLGDVGSEKDIPLLKPMLKDKSWGVRGVAAEALGKIGKSKHIYLMKPLLKIDGFQSKVVQDVYLPDLRIDLVRATAVKSLGMIGTVEDIPILKSLINDKNRLVRCAVAEAIGKIGEVEHASLLSPLINDKDSSVRCSAVEALGKIGTSNHTLLLLNPILGDRDYYVRKAIAQVLGDLGTKKDIPLLVPFLKDNDSMIRRVAVEALGKISTDINIPLLACFLRDNDIFVRFAATKALSKFVTSNNIKLLEPFLKDSDREVRKSAVEVFREVGTVNDFSLLMPLLNDKDWGVREAAADAMGIICTTDKIHLLKFLLFNGDSIVRHIAAKTLGIIGKEKNIPLLRFFLRDKNIYHTVVEAIAKIYKRATPKLNIDDILSQKVKREPILYYPCPSQPFHILHISDIHYAINNQISIERIFHEFLEDISNWRKLHENNKIHAVCLTGDITKSGSPDQYDIIQKNIKAILSTAGCSDEGFFIVPGNHDIQNYKDISPKLQEILLAASENHHYINREVLFTIENYQPFYDKFSNYYNFIQKYGYKNSLPEEIERGIFKPWYSRGLGDYPIRITGLNSALFCLDSMNKYGQIRMGTDQFTKAYLDYKTPNPTKKELVLILTHHPLQWFCEEENYELKTLMERYSVIHLYGHIHKTDIGGLFSLSGNTWLSVGTGSLYGAKGTEDINTYHILTFDFKEKAIHIRARRWNPEMGKWTVYDDETRNTFPFPQSRIKTDSD